MNSKSEETMHIIFKEGQAERISAIQFDLLRRLVSYADGNAFYGPYEGPQMEKTENIGYDGKPLNPEYINIYNPDLEPDYTDLSIQYRREAEIILLFFSGLGIDMKDFANAMLCNSQIRDAIKADKFIPHKEECKGALEKILSQLK